MEELIELCNNVSTEIYYIYVHWTAGRYNQVFDDYHICITGDGAVHLMTEDLGEHKSHTWHRNSNAIGVSLCCAYGAVCGDASPEGIDFGDYPPTQEQIDSLVEVLKILCEHLNLEPEAVLTHAEVADIDGYGINDDDPEMRWDLLYIPTEEGIVAGGEYLREKLRG